ncbi:TonB-dependent hemoglobin/transferrin/lactoferrin family receptor [Parendozoicomonas haliclonae]|uniref:Putative hemoglobin and hemoglobin-haptoglobin-binding protein 1 n=1 Tax=Parendozoicomonas haliclonae TaxID=1960125 RepID=A0A1X7AGC5_9GAMM|nr:TonB-dependent hemoglobin/transferrin/lactoferrin family receptor [Parendozoicomonas haliclonae]SMA38534.1 putative hemoglobin and hemoglobin-haptoglobin-binding protein 1 precursor [Parendozoicomonas haliclonae]
MSLPKPRSLSLLALAVMSASTAWAEQPVQNTSATMLNQVTVSATRTEKQLKDVAGAVSVIDSAQMEDQMVQNIRDLVRYEPGVQVGEGFRGGMSGFTIRGMSGNNVKVAVDGMDLPQSFSMEGAGNEFISATRNFVDPEALKAVEIVKGPASSLYGSDAIAGMVAFETKDPADLLKSSGDDSHASVKAGYASVNEGFTETISLANRSGKLETMMIHTRRDNKETDTNGGRNVKGSDRGQANPSESSLNSLLTKAQYQINDDHRIGFTGEVFDAVTDVEFKTGGIMDMISIDPTGKDTAKRYRVGFEHQWEADLALFDSLDWQVDLQQSETEMVTHQPRSNGHYREKVYSYEEKGIQLGAQFNKAVTFAGLEHNLVYGLNASHSKVDNDSWEYRPTEGSDPIDKRYVPETTAKKLGLFLQDDVQLTDRLNITAGIRYDEFSFDPDGTMFDSSAPGQKTDATKSEGDKVTGRIGTVYKMTDTLSAFAQFSQGFKAPDYMDMYYGTSKSGADIKANPDLKPEESNSFEVGLRGNYQMGSFEVATFINKYKNFIQEEIVGTNSANGNDIVQNMNVSKVDIKGIELRGDLWLDDAINAPEGTTLRGSLAWAEGENKDTGENLNSVAPLTAVIGLGYDAPSDIWGGEMAWTLVKGKSDSDVEGITEDNQFNPAGYGTVDMTAYYNVSEDLTLRAGLFNITDKQYWNLNDVDGLSATNSGLDRYAEPGRNVSVSMSYTF